MAREILTENLCQACKDAISDEETTAYYIYESKYTDLEVSFFRDGKEPEIRIVNTEYNQRTYPNLKQAVMDSIPNWGDMEKELAKECYYDEWDEHGFRDAADYNRWRYGRL